MTIEEVNEKIALYLSWEKHFMEIGLYALAAEMSDTADLLIQERYKLEDK